MERSHRQRSNPQEASETPSPENPLQRQPQVAEAHLNVGRAVSRGDGHIWTGNLRSKGARAQTTQGESPARGQDVVCQRVCERLKSAPQLAAAQPGLALPPGGREAGGFIF